ncbi:SulP family inorganic anion transporter [Mariniplasma anaerobium]|uniref:Sodium-independent anion transporter n=1 Tax=Mariniplasma anaerobium TaxID=2735436 RepID=A0A7U9TGK9_9MOLU|nr:SulP family inorganic anion transporter [Mariniplasma anaerobium]BCR35740.1 sodium-independent anion transporter [Mariniplasma anaerobium]
MSRLKPKLFSVMKTYTKAQFLKDIIAGSIVAIIALPLSIALAIASGASPESGLYAAIIGGFIISFLGGSRVQIGGPTGAFMVIVFGIITEFGMDGLIIAMIMAGIIMIFLGLLKMGTMIKFIPYPIITGFTSGIAFVIFSSQINDFLGLGISQVPSDFIDRWKSYALNFLKIDLMTFLIGALTLIIIIFWPKVSKKIPGTLIALIIASLLVGLFDLNVATIGTKFGTLSSSFPKFQMPTITFDLIKLLIAPAFVIAFLASVESLLSAVVSDGMIGSKHQSNMELIAQGAANIGSAFFGGIPVTGALARTVANIKNGGRTPIAGITHSIVLLIILVSLMPLVQHVPLTSLAAILFIVAYNMSEWREFKGLLKSPKSDVAILLTTFVLTITVDLVVALEIGLVMSMFLFMKRMSDVSDISIKNLDFTETNHADGEKAYTNESKKYPSLDGVKMYQINGPFFFGAAFKYIEAINQLDTKIEYLIIGMKHVPAIDATALHSFHISLQTCKSKHITVLITGLRSQPYQTLLKANMIEKIGEDHIFKTIEEAVQMIKNNRETK